MSIKKTSKTLIKKGFEGIFNHLVGVLVKHLILLDVHYLLLRLLPSESDVKQ